jgi:DNA-binding FadR family transcriptional regulator
MGIVQTIHGSGGASFVRRPDASLISDSLIILLLLEGISVRNVMEARMFLAPSIAALAAERGTDEEREHLAALFDEVDHSNVRMSHAVYYHIASMSHNRVLEILSNPLIRIVNVIFSNQSRSDPLYDQHRQLIQAIIERDSEKASEKMRAIMEWAYSAIGGQDGDMAKGIAPLVSSMFSPK